MSWIRRIVAAFSAAPAQKAEADHEPGPPVIAVPRRLPLTAVPDFIRMVAKEVSVSQAPAHEAGTAIHPYRDPRRALERISSRAAGTGVGRGARTRAAADAAESIAGGLATLPELDAQRFTLGTAGLEHRNGAEHHVFFDPATRRVIKLTMPGEFGAWGGLEEYLQRMAWVNEFFDDDVLIQIPPP